MQLLMQRIEPTMNSRVATIEIGYIGQHSLQIVVELVDLLFLLKELDARDAFFPGIFFQQFAGLFLYLQQRVFLMQLQALLLVCVHLVEVLGEPLHNFDVEGQRDDADFGVAFELLPYDVHVGLHELDQEVLVLEYVLG